MPTTNIVVGPMSLANFLARDSELIAADVEMDIKNDPDLYYPEYVALCDELGTRHLSEDAWYDLCRS